LLSPAEKGPRGRSDPQDRGASKVKEEIRASRGQRARPDRRVRKEKPDSDCKDYRVSKAKKAILANGGQWVRLD